MNDHPPEPPKVPEWGSWQRMTVATVTLLGTAVAIAIFAIGGYSPLIAVIGGMWWGMVPILLLFGGMMAVAPARMIRFSQGTTPQPGSLAAILGGWLAAIVGSWLSKLLGSTGPRPWESPVARHRTRTLGLLYVVVGLGVGVVLLFLRG